MDLDFLQMFGLWNGCVPTSISNSLFPHSIIGFSPQPVYEAIVFTVEGLSEENWALGIRLSAMEVSGIGNSQSAPGDEGPSVVAWRKGTRRLKRDATDGNNCCWVFGHEVFVEKLGSCDRYIHHEKKLKFWIYNLPPKYFKSWLHIILGRLGPQEAPIRPPPQFYE